MTINTVHWFDFDDSRSLIPLNNSITLISPVQSLYAADSICVALQISEQFSPKARTPCSPLDDELGPDFNAK